MRPAFQKIIINGENLDLHDIAPYVAYAKAMRIPCSVVTFIISDAEWGTSEEEALATRAKINRLKDAVIPEKWEIWETVIRPKAEDWWHKEHTPEATPKTILDSVRNELSRPYPSIQRLKALTT